MNCPRCHTVALHERDLETNLPSSECPHCAGHWIAGKNYWAWLEGHGETLPEKPAADGPARPVDDTGFAMKCPDCGHILRRDRVGHELAFALDHCGHCGGVWFDGGEWETLKSRNLHDEVHAIFSHVWQSRVSQEERAREQAHLLQAKFGDADLAEARRIRAWLAGHPKKYDLYALIHPDQAA